jgi:alkanesulfonate monooxygenase SsuD/methylene tetrahydromethanopterin reductase-like flavin-dependent oxidoreductase (luciferase family)
MKLGINLSWQNVDWDRYETGDFSRPPAMPDLQVYEENRHLANLVEPLGFDGFFAVEHHMTPHHMTGSGLQLLTYVAARTKRVDIGTCLIVLPWHHPVQVAEEICFLDNLLDGRRLWLGFGRGASPREFTGLGLDMGESRERFVEGAEIVRRCLTEDKFSHQGTFYTLPEVTVRPRPRTPDIADRMYAGTGTGSSLEVAANLGLKLMFVAAKPWDLCAEDVRVFNGIRSERGWEPMKPIVVAPTFCAPTEDEAWDGAHRYLGNYLRTSVLHYQMDKPEKFVGVKGYESYVTRGEASRDIPSAVKQEGFARSSLWGTPEQCIEKIQWLADNVHAEYVVALSNAGGMPLEVAERSIRLLAGEVLPAVKDIEAAPFATSAL